MIIKSLRGKTKYSLNRLITYFGKGAKTPTLYSQNLIGDLQDPEVLAGNFLQNAVCLPKRKNGNLWYHEIISLPGNRFPEDQMEQVLIDLAKTYIAGRAADNLVYGRIHHGEQPHIHLLISANGLRNSRRTRHTTKEFKALRIRTENYKIAKYPAYPERIYGTPPKARSISEREYQLQKRSKSPTTKSGVARFFGELFKRSQDPDYILEMTKQAGFAFYQRGKQIGIRCETTGTKYRLKTLGLHQTFLSLKDRLQILKMLTPIRQSQGALLQTKERTRERKIH